MMVKMVWLSLDSLATVAGLFLCFLGSINSLKSAALMTVYSELSNRIGIFIFIGLQKAIVLILKNTVTSISQARWMGIQWEYTQ